MNDIGLKPEKLCGMTTDGAPSMVERTNGVVSLMEKVRQDAGATAKLFRSHCIIHQENLCGKSVKMQNVMSVVVKTVNFVRARGLNHRQFQHLLAEMNAQYQDLLYYCEVRWLSRRAMLRRVYELRNEISLFMEQKGTEVPEFADPTWMCDFAFLVDVTAHLNQLNVQLQGREHLINELFQFVSAFEMKWRLWETQLRNANYVHFPTLMENKPASPDTYVAFVELL